MSNRYTCINSDGLLAELDSGAVPFWWHRPTAREAAKEQPGKWSIITVNSRRYHAGVANTFGRDASAPQLEAQDEPPQRD